VRRGSQPGTSSPLLVDPLTDIVMKSIQVIYQIGEDIIDTKCIQENQLCIALQAGQEKSNRHNKDVEVTIIEQSYVRYSMTPTRRKDSQYVPPRTDESPSVCDFLNRGS